MENELLSDDLVVQPPSDDLLTQPDCPAINLYSWWLWRKRAGLCTSFVVIHRDRHVETDEITHIWILEMGTTSPIRYTVEKFWTGIQEKKLWEPMAQKTASTPVTAVPV